MTYAECVRAIQLMAPAEKYWTVTIEAAHHAGQIEIDWCFYLAGSGFTHAPNADELVRRVQASFEASGAATDIDSVGGTP
jgi:hypothetical protein